MCSGDTDPMQIGGAKMICAFSIEKVLAEETHFIRDASIASERVAKGQGTPNGVAAFAWRRLVVRVCF